MNKSRFVALVALLALFGMTALVPVVGGNNFGRVVQASSSNVPSWIFAGSFLQYKINMNSSVAVTEPPTQYSNGGQFALNYTLQGTEKLSVSSISNNNVNITLTPNLSFTTGIKYPNGTLSAHIISETSANASSFLMPLSLFGSDNLFNDSSTPLLGDFTSLFSPDLNITVSRDPVGIYNWNGNNVAAIHFDSNITSNIHSSLGQNSGLSLGLVLNGTLNGYYTASQDMPLYVGLKLNGSIAIEGITGKMHLAMIFSLLNTNIDLGSGQAQESTVNVPSYSSTIYILSNSTITSSGTSGNQLLLSVSGTSGTQGYATVIVSQKLLSNSGVTNPSQIQVSVDGQTYSDYSVLQIGGNYIIIVHYHHSSHNMAISFGNANLGTNAGSVSSLSSGQSLLSTENLYILVAVVLVTVLVVGFAVAIRSRKKGATAQPVPILVPASAPTDPQ